jgi:hypothetical protein
MAEEIEAKSEGESRSAGGSISDQVQTLREKVSNLSETLIGVEETMREAAGESKE